MLDLKYVRNNFEEVKRVLQFRGEDLTDLGKFEELDVKRRSLIADTEKLKSKRNEVSQQVAVLKREKKDADQLIVEMREVGDQIKGFDDELREVESQLGTSGRLSLIFHMKVYQWVKRKMIMLKSVNGANCRNLSLNRNHIGMWLEI